MPVIQIQRGQGFPVVLVVNAAALGRLCEAISDGRQQLANAGTQL
ncbi:hypothetical protein [Actinokineospora bangkokensis]|nr:hypothetical protein [Actinokineospora bangkokensis]